MTTPLGVMWRVLQAINYLRVLLMSETNMELEIYRWNGAELAGRFCSSQWR